MRNIEPPARSMSFFRTEKIHYVEKQLICRDFRKDCIDSPTSARATTPVPQARSSSACGPSLRIANASLKARRISPMSSGRTQIRTRLRSPVHNGCARLRWSRLVSQFDCDGQISTSREHITESHPQPNSSGKQQWEDRDNRLTFASVGRSLLQPRRRSGWRKW